MAALVYAATLDRLVPVQGRVLPALGRDQSPRRNGAGCRMPLRSLAHYHLEAYKFHQGLSSDHPYEASAWSWLVMGRPTSFFYESPKQGSPGCDTASCTSAILSVGNPLIWWSAAVCLGVLLFWWAGRRDWRAGAVLAGVARRLPALVPVPGTHHVLLLRRVLRAVPGPGPRLLPGPRPGPAHGPAVAAAFRASTSWPSSWSRPCCVSAFFYPVWTAEIISYQDWRFRMWMPSWI